MTAANASFAPRLAGLVERHCAALQDFNGEGGETVALSLGCGVGGTATALADSFQRVVAVDASQLCIDAAKVKLGDPAVQQWAAPILPPARTLLVHSRHVTITRSYTSSIFLPQCALGLVRFELSGSRQASAASCLCVSRLPPWPWL